MNKKLLKFILIAIGIILLLITFILYLIDTGNVLDAFIFIALEGILDFGEIESILTILGLICLIVGLMMQSNKNNNIFTEENSKKHKIKYQILKISGYLPFIGILCCGIYHSIVGFSIFFSDADYGVSAFLASILMFSLFIWPLYIIGIILIIKSSKKLKELNK